MEAKFPLAPGRGRPKKFGRPARAVTVTLPEDILAKLSTVDPDLGRAIVAMVEGGVVSEPHAIRPAELASYGKQAVIVVTPLRALKRLPGVRLVPVANGRCLISLDHQYSISRLELEIRDAIERGHTDKTEHEALEAIADILRRARGSADLSLEERTIVVLEAKRSRRSA